tara:strand:+ start:50 stop:826 length:777 start_codon:yes stop_codon:yes gene_type:complete
MNDIFKNLKRDALPILSLLVIGLIVGLSARANVELVREWQTLITGFLALGGAAVTVIGIRQQLKQSDDHFAEEKRRKAEATRAVAGMALADLIGYTRETAEWLSRVPETEAAPNEEDFATLEQSYPRWSEQAIARLANACEFADAADQQNIANLLLALQVRGSRLEGLWEEVQASMGRERQGVMRSRREAELARQVFDTAMLHASLDGLFKWARGGGNRLRSEVSSGSVHNALRVLGFRDERHKAWRLFRDKFPDHEY